MLERVLLPAPFSPSSAWTSPSSASKSTPAFAITPGNRLVIPRQAIAGRPARAAMTAPRSPVGSIERDRRLGGGVAATPASRCSALRASFDALDEPVHGVEIRQDLQRRALRHLQLAALVVERPGEDVELAADNRGLLRGDHRLRLGR